MFASIIFVHLYLIIRYFNMNKEKKIVNFDSFCTINAPAPRFSALMGGLDEVHPSSGRCILGHSHQEF